MTVMADVFGDRRSFTMRIPLVDEAGPGSPKIAPDPVTRSFDSFSSAALECALSRVYLGIHFRYDSIEGNRLGAKVGRYALETHLGPVPQAYGAAGPSAARVNDAERPDHERHGQGSRRGENS
jgi:hypothetical protein